MVVLESCPKHNMVAYLEKTDGNTEFHEIIDFLTRSSIHHALTVSPIVSTTFFEQFWTYAKSKIINNVRHITAKVAGKPVSISEASIRSDLLFDDANGIDSLPNQAIFDAIQLMGSKSTSWDQISTNIATAVICLTSNQKYNFSKLIFDDNQLANVPVPLDHFPVNALTSKKMRVSLQKDNLKHNIHPLLDPPAEPQPDSSPGHTSKVPIEPQTDPRPSPSTIIPDSIPESSGGNLGDQAKEIQHLKAQIKKLKKQAKPVIKQHRRRKSTKGEPSVHRDPLFHDIPEDTLDHMETENAQAKVSTDKEKISTDRPIVSTDGSKVSIDRQIEGIDEQIESTDEQRKGTEDHTEEGSATQATQTPTSTIFRDDETIAKVLLNMSQAKTVSREKEKPLPKIDPKDKGKKKIEEEDESESESNGIPEARKKFKQLASDEEMARKIQEEWEGKEERNRLAEEKATNEALIRKFDDIKARIEAGRLLAEKLQEQEREQFTIEERANKEEESTRKRKLGTRKKMKSRKRRYIQNTSEDDSDKENDELRLHLTIAPDEEKETDQAKHIEEINQNVVIRSNRQKRYFSTLMRVLSIFDREDLNAMYQLVMDRFQDEMPEGFHRVLWGDLMVVFNPDDKDEFWNSQLDWIIVSWKLHSSSGVHTLVTEAGLVIHMLVEKKYPLRKEVLMQMLKLKLESEEDSTMALELI
ncbi:hypothetical protein Tco_1356039, partial [Tanacetum coccineum]